MKDFKRICGYIRKSRGSDKTEEEELQEQKSFVMKKEVDLGQTIDIFQEIASGETIEDRKEFVKMIHLIKSGFYDCLVCKDLTRLTRGSFKDMEVIESLLIDYNITVIDQFMTYSNDNPMSMMSLNMLLHYSKNEYSMIKGRLFGGRKEAAKRGEWMNSGNIPFGYEFDAITKRLTPFEVDGETFTQEAKLLQMIFSWYGNDGKTIRWICGRLNELKVKTKRGSYNWARSTIRGILKNEAYLGYVIFNEFRTVKQDGVRKRIRNNEKDIVYVKSHPPIIDEVLFNRVQTRFDDNTQNYPVSVEVEVGELARLVCCPECGKYMHKNFYDTRATLVDGTVKVYEKRYLNCKPCGVYFNYFDVLDAILELLKKLRVNEKELRKYYNEMELFEDTNENEIEFIKREMQKEEKRMVSRRELFLKHQEAGTSYMYPEAQFENDMKTTFGKIESLKTELEGMLKNEKPLFADVKRNAKNNLKKMIDVYDLSPSSSIRNEVLKTIIDSVNIKIIEKGKGRKKPVLEIEIHLNRGLFV